MPKTAIIKPFFRAKKPRRLLHGIPPTADFSATIAGNSASNQWQQFSQSVCGDRRTLEMNRRQTLHSRQLIAANASTHAIQKTRRTRGQIERLSAGAAAFMR
jgi:hypothetical protein